MTLWSAPLQVAVQIALPSGERCFRLSSRIELPPRLTFTGALPIEGAAEGRVSLALPGGHRIASVALLHHDPEHPERGSEAELRELSEAALSAIQGYIAHRSLP